MPAKSFCALTSGRDAPKSVQSPAPMQGEEAPSVQSPAAAFLKSGSAEMLPSGLPATASV